MLNVIHSFYMYSRIPADHRTLLSEVTDWPLCMYSSIAAPFHTKFLSCLKSILCNLCILQASVQVMRSAVIANVPDLPHFFWDHLKTDLRIIGRCLSKGENEVVMVLHRIIHQLAGRQPTIGRCAEVGSVVTQMYNSLPEYILHNYCVIHTCRC